MKGIEDILEDEEKQRKKEKRKSRNKNKRNTDVENSDNSFQKLNQPLLTNYFQAPEIIEGISQTNTGPYVVDEENIEENLSEDNSSNKNDQCQNTYIKGASFTKKWEKFTKTDPNSTKKRGWYRCAYICPYG